MFRPVSRRMLAIMREWLDECANAGIFADVDPFEDSFKDEDTFQDGAVLRAVHRNFDRGLDGFLSMAEDMGGCDAPEN